LGFIDVDWLIELVFVAVVGWGAVLALAFELDSTKRDFLLSNNALHRKFITGYFKHANPVTIIL
jgi:hypothetical protein